MEIIERTLTFGGKSEQVFFKPLTGAQQLDLVKGQKYTTSGNSGSVEIDLGTQLEKNYKLVQMTLCDAEGNPIYRQLADMLQHNSKRLGALVRLANEVHKDEDAGNA